MSKTQTPPYLKKGDTVGILCTARSISKEELAGSIELLESWGLKVVLGKTIGKVDHQMGGSDAEKIEDLQNMLDHPELRCIWIARGGYGTARIIDELNFEQFKKQPKWITGFSDVTVLHSHLLENVGVASLHAPLCSTLKISTQESVESMRRALFGERLVIDADPHILNRAGRTEGIVCGGNLSILYSLQGTTSALNTKGKILFLEDIDEYLYHIDRMMVNLKRSGMLNDLAGLVVGGMTDMNDNSVPFGSTAEEIIRQHVEEYDYPVCFEFPVGHDVNNWALFMGKSAKLEVDAEHVHLSFS